MNQFKTSLETYKGYEIQSEMGTRQLCSRQDHAAYGAYENGTEKIYWGVAFDGHGKPQAIDKIRKAKLDEIMKTPTPWSELQNLLEKDLMSSTDMKIRSGSTMVLTKITIFDHKVEIAVTNIGDSRAVVFLNGEPVFVSTPHSCDNGPEIVRLIQEKRVNLDAVYSKSDFDFEVISPTTLRSVTGTYVWFNTPLGRQELAMTQSLGHNGYTGMKPDTTIITCKTTDHIHVVMCSDGVTDILPVNGLDSHDTFSFMKTSTTALLDEAERRWKQTWIVHQDRDLTTLPKTKFPKDGYDDCCCTMLTLQPRPIAFDEYKEELEVQQEADVVEQVALEVQQEADVVEQVALEVQDDEDDIYA